MGEGSGGREDGGPMDFISSLREREKGCFEDCDALPEPGCTAP